MTIIKARNAILNVMCLYDQILNYSLFVAYQFESFWDRPIRFANYFFINTNFILRFFSFPFFAAATLISFIVWGISVLYFDFLRSIVWI